VVAGDGVQAGGRRGEVAVRDAAGEPVPDLGEHAASQARQELPDRVVLHGAGGRGEDEHAVVRGVGAGDSSAVARSMASIAARVVGCSRSARLGGSPAVVP
jgi:hypothetical protein